MSIFRSEHPKGNYFYFNLDNCNALMNQEAEFNCSATKELSLSFGPIGSNMFSSINHAKRDIYAKRKMKR